MNLARILDRLALAYPELAAVALGPQQVWSYEGLARNVAALAGALRSRLGLRQGDRVALAMSNRPEFFEIAYAVWRAGCVLVPMNPRLHPREFGYIIANSGASLCFVSPDLAASLGSVANDLPRCCRIVEAGSAEYGALRRADACEVVDLPADAPAWIFYTSGTTGRPKGATLTHRNLAFMTAVYYPDIDGVEPGHAMLHPAALSHGAGLYSLPHLAQGGTQVVCESPSFEPAEICDLVGSYRQVSLFAAPTMLTRLVSHADRADADTRELRTIVYGGGPMYVADLQRALAVLGPKLAQIYGQGETPMTISGLPKWLHGSPSLLSTCGIPRSFVELRVVDEEGRDVRPGEIGEVVTRSDCVMAGYWNMPDATAAALKGGWLHTGDLGSLDERGFLTLKDRSKDMIISGGSNIYPREVEEVLLLHPGVAEVSVVGRPHPDWVEEAVAFIVARPGEPVEDAELDALCLDHIARYKRPRAYLRIEELPKNNYGKVLKTELRARLAQLTNMS